MPGKTFRQRVIAALGRTQDEAAQAVGMRQSSICRWASRVPERGTMIELLELALAELGDEQIQGLLRGAAEKRAASQLSGIAG